MRAIITFLIVLFAIGVWAVPAFCSSPSSSSSPVSTPFRFSEITIDQRMADASLAAAEADEAAAAAIQAQQEIDAQTETETEADAEADLDNQAEAQAEAKANDTPAASATGTSPAPASSATGSAEPTKKSKYVRVTVLSPPPPPHHKKKHKGNFKYRPLLDNGKEFHTKERKREIDHCTGCYKKPKKLSKMVWDKKLHKLVKRKVSRLLPVQPELRDRETKWQKKWRARQARKRIAVSPHHLKPEFYPREKKFDHKKERAAYLKWRKAHRLKHKKHKKRDRRHHHKQVLKRLPHVPEFYPKKKAKKIYPPAIRAAREFAKKEKKCREDKKKAKEAAKAAKAAAAAAASTSSAASSTGASA